VSEPMTVVCAWRHTHTEEKHLGGPPRQEGAKVSHGLCADCLRVELEAMRPRALYGDLCGEGCG
jgi:hypothetical protein